MYLWPDEPRLRVHGEVDSAWLKTVQTAAGKVALIGECFASEETVQETAHRALTTDPSSIARLPGNYTSILLKTQGDTHVLTSLSGLNQVYYARQPNGIRVGSKPEYVSDTLTPHIGQAVALALVTGAGANIFAEKPGLNNVAKMRGRHMLRIQREKFDVAAYDELLPQTSLPPEQAYEAFGDALQQAVRYRTRHERGLSADMSGGMDSSSLAFLAAHQLPHVPTFMAWDSRYAEGDIEYVQKYLQLAPNLTSQQYDARVVGGVSAEDFLQTPWSPDISMSLPMMPHVAAYLQKYYSFIAESLKSDRHIHMTGDGGDEIAAIDIAYLRDVASSGNFARFTAEAKAWARLQNTSISAITRQSLTPPQAQLHKHISLLDLASSSKLDRSTITQPLLAWFTPEALRMARDALSRQMHTQSIPDGLGFGGFTARNAIQGSAHDVATSRHYARTGLSMQAPFLDNDVVKAAFNLPAAERGNPYFSKPLLQRSLAGMVPDAVLERKTKGFYETSHLEMAQETLASLRDILTADSRLVQYGILRPEVIPSIQNQALIARPQTVNAISKLISLEGWLRSLDDVPQSTRAGREQVVLTQPQPKLATALSSEPYGMPRHIRAVTSKNGQLALFDTASGTYHMLDQTQSTFMRLLADGKSPAAIEQQFVRRYPTADPTIIARDIQAFVDLCEGKQIIRSGVTERHRLPVAPGRTRNFFEVKNASGSVDAVAKKHRILTAALVVGGVALDALAPGRKLEILQKVQARRAHVYADDAESKALLNSAYSAPYLGRVACSETSWAAAMAAAIKGKRLDWHVGVDFKPLAFHAWVENKNGVVDAELAGRVNGSYQSFFDTPMA